MPAVNTFVGAEKAPPAGQPALGDVARGGIDEKTLRTAARESLFDEPHTAPTGSRSALTGCGGTAYKLVEALTQEERRDLCAEVLEHGLDEDDAAFAVPVVEMLKGWVQPDA